jgi:peptide chain release factor
VSVHLLMSAGRGPRECAWALARLLHRLTTEANQQNLKTQLVRTVPGDRPGTYRSALLQIAGTGAEAFVATWTGTLCWQAPSPYRSGTGRKNWYVIARVYELDAPRMTFTEADVDFVALRTGGPGGQRRNKVSTAVRATHRPSGIVVVVDTQRLLSLNRRLALERLRDRIERGDEAAGQAAVTARWRVHDELIRGNPTRVERPAGPEEPARPPTD